MPDVFCVFAHFCEVHFLLGLAISAGDGIQVSDYSFESDSIKPVAAFPVERNEARLLREYRLCSVHEREDFDASLVLGLKDPGACVLDFQDGKRHACSFRAVLQ